MTAGRLLMFNRRRLLTSILALPLVLPARVFAEGEDDAPSQGPMAPVAARYAALKSYADKGTVTTDYQWPDTPRVTEHCRIETAFRAPRNFFFRFDRDPDAGGDIYVIWCDGRGPFQSWWKSTGVHEVYDGGRGASAFLTGDETTKGSANVIAPHLFPQALLYGATLRLLDIGEGGEEAVDGHPCRKITAGGRQTGVVTSERRPIAIWTDKDGGLIRKVLVDRKEGSPAGLIDLTTYQIEPIADPDLPDERFAFTPPA